MASVAAAAMALAGCGGATVGVPGGSGDGAGGTDGTGGTGGTADPQPGASKDPPSIHPPVNPDSPKVAGADCESPTPVQVASGGVILRPAGSALRLQLVYQGSTIGVTNVRGVDMLLPPADGPFTPGKIAGYWFETRSQTATTYQHLFQDPTRLEAPPPPGGGDFGNSTIDRCTPKTFLVDVPNDAGSTELVIFGSPYGTSDGAVELARFDITISTK